MTRSMKTASLLNRYAVGGCPDGPKLRVGEGEHAAMVFPTRWMSIAVRVAPVGLFGRLLWAYPVRSDSSGGPEMGRGKTDATQGIRQVGQGSPCRCRQKERRGLFHVLAKEKIGPSQSMLLATSGQPSMAGSLHGSSEGLHLAVSGGQMYLPAEIAV